MAEKVNLKYEKFLMLNSSTNSKIPYVNLYITDAPLKRLFLELAFEMTPFWNSLPYTNIREFTTYMGRQSYTVFGHKIHQLVELDAICIKYNYLYVNPFLATKSNKIYSLTRDLFVENDEYRIKTKIEEYIAQIGGGV